MVNLNFNRSPRTPEIPVVKKEAIEKIRGFNINDSDILEKLAKVAGCDIEDFNRDEFAQRKEDARNGESSEWYITKGGVKFYMLGDGNIHLVGKDTPQEVKSRALEMGMNSIG